MPHYFTIRMLLLDDGERLPVLRRTETGIPEYHPNLFALSQLRQGNLAVSTIDRALQEIAVLLDYEIDAGINLLERIQTGQHLLTLSEIDGLIRYCRTNYRALRLQKNRVIDINAARNRQKERTRGVSSSVKENRIRRDHAYLRWLIALHYPLPTISDAVRMALDRARTEILPQLLARIPKGKGRNNEGRREAASEETLIRLKQVIDPASDENPWRRKFCRHRNELIVRMCWKLGIRRGELAAIEIDDIDFQKNELLILRKADNPRDPRRRSPLQKTRDRKLHLRDDLAAMLHDHILNHRRQVPGASRHSFLLVADRKGKPLSMSAINRIFDDLRRKCVGIPADLVPHVLRHTWSEDLVAFAERKGLSEDDTKKMHEYLAGWNPGSGTAAKYIRRRISELANQFLLETQTQSMELSDVPY